LVSGTGLARGQDIEKTAQVSFSSLWQQENFHWSIAGNNNGTNPNILSELKWKNITGPGYSVALHYKVWLRIMLYADYNRTAINSGAVSDRDYNGDNRTAPVYSENFSDNKGHTSSWSLGAGYAIFNNNRFSFAPSAGYGENNQSLYLVDLTGQFPGLNSSYRANWKGAFLKVASSLKLLRALKLSVDVTYNQVNYNADGDWNLINEFQHPVSYSHIAKGYGINTNARLTYAITHHIAVDIGYGYFNWQTGTGNDLLYLSSGQVDKTRLNGVFRNGHEVAGGVLLSF